MGGSPGIKRDRIRAGIGVHSTVEQARPKALDTRRRGPRQKAQTRLATSSDVEGKTGNLRRTSGSRAFMSIVTIIGIPVLRFPVEKSASLARRTRESAPRTKPM